jgi:hypothetical protein
MARKAKIDSLFNAPAVEAYIFLLGIAYPIT